jgi:hypothetical protein
MSSPEIYLLKGGMPELSKMKRKDLLLECQMWRNIWGWVPPEVKYYVARVGQDIGLTLRNYRRYLGTLIDTHWVLDSVELGVIDKVYDSVKDKTFFEKKVMIIQDGAILYTEWMKERKDWETLEAETQEAEQKEELDVTTTADSSTDKIKDDKVQAKKNPNA